MKKILIFNPFGIGDVLFTTPLIRNLKESLPDVSIDYLCNRRVYPLLKNNKFLSKVFIFEKDEWRAIANKSKLKFLRHAFLFFNEVRGEKYDVLFDLSLNSQYGFFFKMAGIKKRIGHNFKNRGRFLTHKVDIPMGYSQKHVARQHLDLLKFLDIEARDHKFDLFLSPNILKKAEGILWNKSISKYDFLVGVCPGSGDSWRETAYFRRWPKENFIKVCKWLQQAHNARIILFGSKSESNICKDICDAMENKPINLCGEILLEEFCGLVSMCRLIITNDGGPLHIARALERKVIVFRGPVSEEVYGCYPDDTDCAILKKDMECRPCYKGFRFPPCPYDKRCLRDIRPEEAVFSIKKMLGYC